MPLESGARLGPYVVDVAIGAGGMGEVYRATDTNLKRSVAIKVLPDALADDAERLARFQREAEVLARLNHPNIAQVYGLERSDGITALVMELVEGPTLADRIAQGAVPVDEALSIARQIAEALEAAHEQGIVHRDLKPANVKVRPDEKVKVLDFGLAKALDADRSGATAGALSQSPTVTSPLMTAAGIILGTAAYLSPEQARGKPVDRRSDIWAFGCCLYESLTGSRPFQGEHITDVLVAIASREPDWDALPGETPPLVRQLLRRCLAKDRRQRLQDIGEARIVLEQATGAIEPFHDPSDTPRARSGPARGLPGWVPWAGLAIVSTVLVGVLLIPPAPQAPAPPPIGFSISSAKSARFASDATTPFAISPDGRTIAFTGSAPSGAEARLWVRTLDDPTPRVLEGTEGGDQPAFSPDGRWIAFVAENRTVKKVAVSGGPVTTLTTLEYNSAALGWLSSDQIAAEQIGSVGIQIVDAYDGAHRTLIPLDSDGGETRQRRPFPLREQRKVVYASTHASGRTTLAMFALDQGARADLGVEGIQVLGVVDGRLVYAREDGVLMAVPFDAQRMRTIGAPLQLRDQVATSCCGVSVALSESGTLVYGAPRDERAHLVLLDASGRDERVGGDARTFRGPRFSPDGKRIAVRVEADNGSDVWVYDDAFASPRRMTRSGHVAEHRWTPDGTRLLYSVADGDGKRRLWSVAVDGGQEPERVDVAGDEALEAELTPDGASLVARRSADLILIPLRKTSGVMTLLAPPAWPRTFRLSPDGSLLAYVDRDPVDRVMVMTLGGRDRVLVGDGDQPVWAHDNRSVFYRSADRWMEARLTTAPGLAVVREVVAMASARDVNIWDVAPGDRGFLALRPLEPQGGGEILVSVNWAARKSAEWRDLRPGRPAV